MNEWTEEQVALLKTWWLEEGRSAREIADALAARSPYVRFSRSAVIGKVYRLGLKRQEASSVAVEPIRLAPATEPGRRTILTVRYGECRWPHGDPRSSTFSLCGCKAREGSTYCDEHHAKAYQPKRPRAVPKALTEPSRQRRAA